MQHSAFLPQPVIAPWVPYSLYCLQVFAASTISFAPSDSEINRAGTLSHGRDVLLAAQVCARTEGTSPDKCFECASRQMVYSCIYATWEKKKRKEGNDFIYFLYVRRHFTVLVFYLCSLS